MDDWRYTWWGTLVSFVGAVLLGVVLGFSIGVLASLLVHVVWP